MMHRFAAIACLLWCAFAHTAVAREPKKPKAPVEVDRRIAVTFDDLPWQWPGRLSADTLAARHAKLIDALRATGVTGVGFVNESQLETAGIADPARVEMLRAWLDAGWELGNHTWGHVDYHAVGLDAFEADVLKGERQLRPLLAERGATPTWFRPPFLRIGTSPEERVALETFLTAHGYRIAPVTVNSSEWIWAGAYQRTMDGDLPEADKQAVLEHLRREYVPYMLSKVDYYERQSQRLLGYALPQVLLLHANEINADTFPVLIDAVKQRGYRIVSLEEALRDPAYAREDNYRGPYGQSWLHRWAATENRPYSFFMGEPKVPKWVLDAAGVASE